MSAFDTNVPDDAPALSLKFTEEVKDWQDTTPFSEAEIKESDLSSGDVNRLGNLYSHLVDSSGRVLGFPANQQFDYSILDRFMKLSINNCGDPFGDTHYGVNTFEFEKEVIEKVSKISGADPSETWGYVTNGGTEGNTCGMYIAREMFPDGIVYFSSHSHYSASKIMRLLKCNYKVIDGNDDGTMNLNHLLSVLEENKTKPAIIFANVGTTMHQAVDDIPGIQLLLDQVGIHDRYIHADAALSGFILPFVEKAPKYNFSIGIDSMAISGHKFIGAPMPCGVMLAKKQHTNLITGKVDYVGVLDSTITGSRNGLTPLILWISLRRVDESYMKNEVKRCMEVADYTIKKFKDMGIHAWRHPYSITVVFPRPSNYMIDKWQLAPHGIISHIVASRHVTKKMIDAFFADAKYHMFHKSNLKAIGNDEA